MAKMKRTLPPEVKERKFITTEAPGAPKPLKVGGRRVGRWGSPGIPRKVGPAKPPKGQFGPGLVETTGVRTLPKPKKLLKR